MKNLGPPVSVEQDVLRASIFHVPLASRVRVNVTSLRARGFERNVLFDNSHDLVPNRRNRIDCSDSQS